MIGEMDLTVDTVAALRRGVKRAREVGAPVLVSVAESVGPLDPLDVFAAAGGRNRFFWSAPDEPVVVGLGAARLFAFTAAADIEREWHRLIDGGVIEATPRLFGALPFDRTRPLDGLWREAPIGRLVLPRFAIEGDLSVTVNLLVTAADDPDLLASKLSRDLAGLRATPDRMQRSPCGIVRPNGVDHFQRLVASALDAIERGELQKVVVARAQYVDGEFDAADVLQRLHESLPHCVTFAFAAGETCFLGATPEWLLRLTGGQARISCLAGTAARGTTEEEDARLGAELMASSKNREEHALVLRELLECLEGVAARVDAGPAPGLVKLPNVQHLFTPVLATVRDHGTLSLAERLHPTPAVAGYPRQEALRFLRCHEDLERGGYAGPVGWVDAAGDGEFAVGIRSALLTGTAAAAFAGCGIVAGSAPESELQESMLKLRPMLSALGAHDG